MFTSGGPLAKVCGSNFWEVGERMLHRDLNPLQMRVGPREPRILDPGARSQN